jgi:uncharacterized protein (TIRG00374 family)
VSVWRNNRAGVLGVIVSAALFAALYSRLDLRAIGAVFRSADPWWLFASTSAIVPITLILAWRFYLAAPPGSLPGYAEAVRLTLVATAFNLFLPSKAGDVTKSYFVAKRGVVPKSVALSIVVYERLCDVVGLVAWCLVGWLLSPAARANIPTAGRLFLVLVGAMCLVLISSERSAGWLLTALHRVMPSRRLQRVRDLAAGWPALHAALRGRRRWIALVSIGLWLGHLTQMWMFTLAVSPGIPMSTGLGLFALSVLAGQLPLTFAGFGARDMALVVLLSGRGHMAPEAAAAIGLLSATRGILPALAALPILRPYLAIVAGEAARWRQRSA